MKLIDRRFDDLNKRLDERDRHIDKRFDDVNKRFDDVNKRMEALERRQREDSKAFSARMVDLGTDVATLAGRVDEATGMLAAVLQAVLGVVVTRRGGKDRGSSVMEQAAFAAAGSDED